MTTQQVIDDPDEPSTSRPDADWVPVKEKLKAEEFSITCKQRKWFESVLPALDHYRNSSENVFHLLHDLFKGSGVDMDEVFLSPSLIDTIRGELHRNYGIVRRLSGWRLHIRLKAPFSVRIL